MQTSEGIPILRIKGKPLLPIVQGGMGVGVSAHRLAGHVAARRRRPDFDDRIGAGVIAGTNP